MLAFRLLLTFVAFTALLTIGNCGKETSGSGSLKFRQVRHAQGSELLSSRVSQVTIGGQIAKQNVDRKSLQEIQEDFARLSVAGSNLQNVITTMGTILNNNINSKSSGSAQYTLGGSYPVDHFVRFYKNTYGYNGYPNIPGIPCAGIPSVTTLPTIPVLIKRITADTSYLMKMYNRGLVTTTTSVKTQVSNPRVHPGVVVPSLDDHHYHK